MSLITAVLPCAGQGQRFAAPYPKELHCVGPGETLLDRALAPLLDLAAKGSTVRIVVVLDRDRALLLRHLGRYSNHFQLLMIFQSRLQDGPSGAVQDSLPYCEGHVLLVLPDQSFDWSPQTNPLARACELLKTSPFAVVAARCDDVRQLQQDGALLLGGQSEMPTVVAAEDKPVDASGYNAVWAALACRSGEAAQLGDVFKPGQTISPLLGTPAVIVTGYRNISRPQDLLR